MSVWSPSFMFFKTSLTNSILWFLNILIYIVLCIWFSCLRLLYHMLPVYLYCLVLLPFRYSVAFSYETHVEEGKDVIRIRLYINITENKVLKVFNECRPYSGPTICSKLPSDGL